MQCELLLFQSKRGLRGNKGNNTYFNGLQLNIGSYVKMNIIIIFLKIKAHTALKIMFSYFSLFFTYIMLLRNFNSWILLRPLPVPLVNCAVKNKTQIL
jgi:hypothetical protein